jgi:hypothetical protein
VELGAGREDSDKRTRQPSRSVFLRVSQSEPDILRQARLPDRLHADLFFELPAAQSASLGHWLGCAAVSAEVGADGVLVRARANRVFRVEDVARVVHEWMLANSVDAVPASSNDALFVVGLSTSDTGTARHSGLLPAGRPVLG